MSEVLSEKVVVSKELNSEFYLDNIPDFSVITVIFLNEKVQNDLLSIPNFYQEEDNPETVSYNLKYSKKNEGYMIAEQNLFNNNVLLSFLFEHKVDFFVKTISISEYNSILYSGEVDER